MHDHAKSCRKAPSHTRRFASLAGGTAPLAAGATASGRSAGRRNAGSGARHFGGHCSPRPARARCRGTGPARAWRRPAALAGATRPLRHAPRARERRPRSGLRQPRCQLIHDGQVLLLDGGTTNLALARRLPAGLRLTVITPSPTIALALAEHAGAEVVLLGGRLDRASQTVVGASALAAVGSRCGSTFAFWASAACGRGRRQRAPATRKPS